MTTKTIEFKEGEVLTKTGLKVDPGAGAVKLAQEFAVGRTYEEVEGIMTDLIDGNFEGAEDKRVKRCHYCGYFYRDVTKNNSSHVCSPECKTGKDIVLKQYRREVRNEGKPKRKLLKDEHYYDGEYSFFSNDFWMREYDRRHQTYSYGNNFEAVVGYHQVKAKNGGKRVNVPQKIDYNGTEKVTPIHVKLPRHDKSVKTASKVKSYKMSREEIEGHLLESYGAKKLAYERRFAQLHSIGKAY